MNLSAFFYLHDNRNSYYTDSSSGKETIAQYRVEEVMFDSAIEYLNKNLHRQMSEVEINAVVFDAARVYNDKNIPLFFKRIYLVLTGAESGAKLSTLIAIMGVENFLVTLNDRLREIRSK